MQPRAEVFEFFSNAGNLELLTPPEVGFNITTPQPIEMSEGTLIDYTLYMYGFPISWRTEITVWDPPNKFIDIELKGPYSQWVHSHTFTEVGPNETLIEDAVRYRLPLEPLGDIAHYFVERQLKYIFDFREKAILEIFSKKDQPAGQVPQ
jgi:ligand-binding SRPBCC domain-containing protein